MGKVKLLLDVIEDIRSLADSLEAVAEAMSHSDPPDTKAEEPKVPTPKAVVEEAPAPATKPMGKEELRAFLGKKSLAGHKDTIQALIHKYGGQKLSDIDPKHYPALQKDAEGLPDAT